MDYFAPNMSLAEVNRISMLGLAHIGDGVYELMTRAMLCRGGHTAIGELHRLTVSFVKAPAQAKAAAKLLPLLRRRPPSTSAAATRTCTACRRAPTWANTTPPRDLRHCSAICICGDAGSG